MKISVLLLLFFFNSGLEFLLGSERVSLAKGFPSAVCVMDCSGKNGCVGYQGQVASQRRCFNNLRLGLFRSFRRLPPGKRAPDCRLMFQAFLTRF